MPACLCGCGQLVSGRSHGRDIRFVHGHNTSRGSLNNWWKGGVRIAQGYKFLSAPDHSRANSEGYVQEHVLVAEKALGKPLPANAVVHHVDENKQHNVGSNLVICQDETYHQHLHRRLRAFRACGHAGWFRCAHCKQYDDIDNMKKRVRAGGRHIVAWHAKCRNESRRKLRQRQVSSAASKAHIRNKGDHNVLDRSCRQRRLARH